MTAEDLLGPDHLALCLARYWPACHVTVRPERPMSDPAFDPREALKALAPGQEPVKAAPPAAAAPAPTPAPPPPSPAQDREQRRSAGLEQVAAYRAAHPGDPRSDDQLLVAPYGGYELLQYPEDVRPAAMYRLADSRPAPPEGPRP